MLQLKNTKARIVKHQLIYILDDCFSEEEVFTLATQCGIYNNQGKHTISKNWLVKDLAEAFFQQDFTERTVNQHLAQKAQQTIRRIGYMNIEEVQTFLRNPTYLLEDGEFGETVWALLIDSREGVWKHGQKLLKDHGRSPPFVDSEEATESSNTSSAEEKSRQELIELEVHKNDVVADLTSTSDTSKQVDAPLQEPAPNSHAVSDQVKRRIVEQAERVNQLEATIEDLRGENTSVKNENNRIRDQFQQLQQENQKLEQQNQILRQKELQYIKDQSRLQQQELENQGLKQKLENLSNKLDLLHNIKVEKAELSVELRSLEDAIYRGQQTVEQIQSEFQMQIAQLKRFGEASKRALVHTQQKIANLACQRPVDRKVKNNIIAGQPCVGVFVDVQNMFYAAKDRYSRRVDYIKLLDLIVGPRQLIVAYAYVVQIPEINQSGFLSLLEHNGYTIKSKELRLRGDGTAKGDWDVGIAIDIVTMLNVLDVVILASGDGDFCALAELIKWQNKRVEVVAFEHNTSMDLQRIADQFFPIGDDLLI